MIGSTVYCAKNQFYVLCGMQMSIEYGENMESLLSLFPHPRAYIVKVHARIFVGTPVMQHIRSRLKAQTRERLIADRGLQPKTGKRIPLAQASLIFIVTEESHTVNIQTEFASCCCVNACVILEKD